MQPRRGSTLYYILVVMFFMGAVKFFTRHVKLGYIASRCEQTTHPQGFPRHLFVDFPNEVVQLDARGPKSMLSQRLGASESIQPILLGAQPPLSFPKNPILPLKNGVILRTPKNTPAFHTGSIPSIGPGPWGFLGLSFRRENGYPMLIAISTTQVVIQLVRHIPK